MIMFIVFLAIVMVVLLMLVVNIYSNNKAKKAAYIEILEELDSATLEEVKARLLKKVLDMDR